MEHITVVTKCGQNITAGSLEVVGLVIEGDVVWVPPRSACSEIVETAQLAIFDGALLCRSARCSRAAQVIGSMTLTSLGATFCPEGLTSLQHEKE